MHIMPMHIGLVSTGLRLQTYRKERGRRALSAKRTTIRHFEHDSNLRAMRARARLALFLQFQFTYVGQGLSILQARRSRDRGRRNAFSAFADRNRFDHQNHTQRGPPDGDTLLFLDPWNANQPT